MNKDLARSLLHIIPDSYDVLQEYVKYRIDNLHQQLETTKDDRRIAEIQGSIQELRLFTKLRDTCKFVVEAVHHG